MNIHSTKLWENPQIICTILLNITKLDLTVIFGNPNLYLLKNKSEIRAFGIIKQRRNYQELKSIYTYPKFRNKGFMLKLIAKISKNNKLYLVCTNNLESFYNKSKFKKTNEKPIALKWRCKLYNLFINPISKKNLIIMKN